MIRRLAAPALLAFFVLTGCHRPKADQIPADDQAQAQAQTSAKAAADIEAAEGAMREPLPTKSASDQPATTAKAKKPAADQAPDGALSIDDAENASDASR